MKRAFALAAVAIVVAGCGGDGARITVYAASSLTEVFQQLDPKARFNFAGSDELAFQIEQGAKADVYAAASTKYPEQLFSKGLAERPHVFATNRLALIVPSANPARISSLGGLMKGGVKLVLAAPGVPVGDYAREVLAAFCKSIFIPSGSHCPRAKVVSNEQDAKAVVAKIALDEADAGFVYVTDAQAAAGKLRVIPVPTRLQPPIRYAIAVLKQAPHPDEGKKFVHLVLGSAGRAALERAGFGLP
jgi:molybdate transport system substrate-binding protein